MKKLLVLLVFLAGACDTSVRRDQWIQEIIETDRAFSALSVEKGVSHAFLEYCDEEGVFLRRNSYPVEGRAAVASIFSSYPDSAVQLSWKPLFANVARSGDLGYSYGIYERRTKPDTAILLGAGTYLSIWKRQEDGGWKYLLDTGNEGLGEDQEKNP